MLKLVRQNSRYHSTTIRQQLLITNKTKAHSGAHFTCKYTCAAVPAHKFLQTIIEKRNLPSIHTSIHSPTINPTSLPIPLANYQDYFLNNVTPKPPYRRRYSFKNYQNQSTIIIPWPTSLTNYHTTVTPNNTHKPPTPLKTSQTSNTTYNHQHHSQTRNAIRKPTCHQQRHSQTIIPSPISLTNRQYTAVPAQYSMSSSTTTVNKPPISLTNYHGHSQTISKENICMQTPSVTLASMFLCIHVFHTSNTFISPTKDVVSGHGNFFHGGGFKSEQIRANGVKGY